MTCDEDIIVIQEGFFDIIDELVAYHNVVTTVNLNVNRCKNFSWAVVVNERVMNTENSGEFSCFVHNKFNEF